MKFCSIILKKAREENGRSLNFSQKFLYLSLVLTLVFNINISAQENLIKGTIVSATNDQPLPGVNIVIKGTTVGTVTNLDGEYQIQAKSEDILVISFIGFLSEEIEVGNQSEISVVLIEDVASLDEIIVIGYGTQKKKLVTGATAQVKGEDLEKRNTTSALLAMQGQAPGVNITSNSGQPGEGLRVSIRGVGTTGDAKPLYIVDGVPTGDIDYLNSADIASIDVLKDAASAAIYGSRAANGVILVTTRQGKAGKSQVTLDAYYGVQKREKEIRTLNTQEYTTIMNEQHLNSNGSVAQLPFDQNNLPVYTTNKDLNSVANTDWLNEMFVNDAVTQNYVLGASGGGENSVYSMSLSYTGQEGIVGGSALSNYERFGARFNSENKLYNGRLKIGENITFSHIKKNGISVGNQYDNTLRGAFGVSPLLPMYQDDGEYFNTADTTNKDQNGDTYWFDEESNPYANMEYNNQNVRRTQKLVGNIYAEIEIFRNLKFRSTLGVNYFSNDNRSFTPIYRLSVFSFQDYTKVNQRMEKGLGLNWDNLLTYTYSNSQHNLVAMVGTSAQRWDESFVSGDNTDLAFDDLEHAWLDNATNTTEANPKMKNEGAPTQNRLLSYFGRVQYDFRETYMFNATLRADGSSKFSKEKRWSYFPSVSAGWVMTNESFMNGVGAVNFLKLRGSWGQNGSQNVDPFIYLAPIQFTQAQYAFGDVEGISTNGAYPNRLSNPELMWETSEQLNIGFDSRFLNSMFIINFDWYKKTTKDWLVLAPNPATAGADAPWINGGNVVNTGVELALTFNGKAGAFNYRINANGAYNNNNVTEIPTVDGIVHGAENMLYNNSEEFYRAESGHAIGYFWGLQTDGLFQYSTDVTNYTNSEGTIIQPNAKPGDLKYIDQNDDGVINDLDKVDLGDPNANLMYGLSFSCDYKGIDFMIITNGVSGNQIVQSYRNHSNQNANYTTDILDRWTGPNTSNTVPRVTNNNANYAFSDIFVKSGSYYRISNVTLGYDLTKVIKVKNISQFRIYASIQNLYTFTKYTGMDPDIGYGFDNGPDDKFSSGIDLGYYPRPRTILMGVNIKF